MEEVRAEIDRIDAALVDLIGERFVPLRPRRAARAVAGRGGGAARASSRSIDRVRPRRARKRACRPSWREAFWRQMIGWFIQYEEEKLRQQLENKDGR